MSTVNQMLIASESDFNKISDREIASCAYGIKYFTFHPDNAAPLDKPTPEMKSRLATLRNRLAGIESAN